MKKIFLLFATLCLFCASCKKDKDLRKPAGRVMDATTNTAIPYASVALIEMVSSGWNTYYYLLSATTTDANGEFSFSNSLQKGNTYVFSAKKNMYYETSASEYVEIKSSFNIVPIKPKAWLKLKIKNVNGIYDQIVVNYPFSGSGTFYGMSVDTSASGEVYYGNSKVPVAWFLYISGNLQINQSVEVYCTAFDTTTYNINY